MELKRKRSAFLWLKTSLTHFEVLFNYISNLTTTPQLYKVNTLKNLPIYLFFIYDENLADIIDLFENVTNVCSILSIMDIVFET